MTPHRRRYPLAVFTRTLSTTLLAITLASCAAALPPNTREVIESARPSAQEATLTFYWPIGSCDPAGHYAIAGDGRGIVARVGRGTRVTVRVEPGARTFWTWNPRLEETMGAPSPTDVALVRIDAQPGRAYLVRLAFGEWDDGGPETDDTQFAGRRRTITRRCAGSQVALVAIGADQQVAADAARVASSLRALELVNATQDAYPERDIARHRELAEARFARLRPNARALATVTTPR